MTDQSRSAGADVPADDPDLPYRAPHRPINEVPSAEPDYADVRTAAAPERDHPIEPSHVPRAPDSYEPDPVFVDGPAILPPPEPPAAARPIAVVPLGRPVAQDLPGEVIAEVPVTDLVPGPSVPPLVPDVAVPELIVGVPTELPPPVAGASDAVATSPPLPEKTPWWKLRKRC